MSALFPIVIAAVILQRLTELMLAKRNEIQLKRQGAFEVGSAHYKYLVMLHILFFVSLIAEVRLTGREIPWWWWAPFSIFMLAQGLRIWSMHALGGRWTTRIYVLPGALPVTHGPYRFMRHPSYIAVALELLSLPMMFGVFYTAVAFSILNAALMCVRIPIENRILSAQPVETASVESKVW